MTIDPIDLAALIGSRICHDLISPIGAIGNGVELLGMAGTGGPEVDLIAQSVAAANARIRFFRIAFGSAPEGQRIAAPEVCAVLADLAKGGRQAYDWRIPGDQPRALVKLAFLVLQCCETAMPYGGSIVTSCSGDLWMIEALAEKLMFDSALWSNLDVPCSAVQSAHVQFALAPIEARRLSRHLSVTRQDNRIIVSF